MSGWEFYGNLIKNATTGVLLGGGRRNVIRDNTFVSCDLDIEFDNRCAKSSVAIRIVPLIAALEETQSNRSSSREWLTLAGLQWHELATCNMQFNKWIAVSKSREVALQGATVQCSL